MMGSCGSGVGGIGPIVWVRRRNGSWWPGKILAPNELSECNLSSPRTGTPVKLLGREDASVDWYNLEKSKRVKAFRCGEFDECIEKAESAHGMPIKKREKYARREDAILHALELEKQLIKDFPKSCVPSESLGAKLSGKKVSVFQDNLANNSGNHVVTRSAQASAVDMDVQDEVKCGIQSTGAKHNSWDEDQSEVTPRMRGLHDLGLRTVPPKRKFAAFEYDTFGRNSQLPPSVAPSIEKMSYINGGEQMGTVFRPKRSRCLYVQRGSGDLRDEKEHSLDQNRVSPRSDDSDMNQSRHFLKEANSSSGVVEDEDSDYSQSNFVDSDSDSSETEPDTNDITASSDLETNAMGNGETRGDQESTSLEEHDDSAFSGDISRLYPDDPYLSNEAVSKWQLKGKRNIRYALRESIPASNGDYTRSSYGTRNGARTSALRHRSCNNDNSLPYPPRNFTEWEDDSRHLINTHLENGRRCLNPMHAGRHCFPGRTRSFLINVELKVQSSYRRESVPIISLLSKSNGMAIVGHPIQSEVMEDGSSESIITTTLSEKHSQNGNSTLPPGWKSARRRNFRAPRPVASAVHGGDDSCDYTPLKKTLYQNSSLQRKSLSHSPRSLLDKKFPKRLPRKVSLSSNQKTRALSSIGGSKGGHDARSYLAAEHVKAELSCPPTVACIPVKLVFSRLLEKINRPPSKAVV